MSVLVPMLNEARYIARCLRSVLAQDYPRDLLEVVVIDGGSTDGSVAIVQGLVAGDPRIRLLGAPGLNCPAALNLGLAHATGTIVCKVDAHGYIAPDFVRAAVERLAADPRLGCVGGPILAVPENAVGRANSLARNARFGVGSGVNTLPKRDQLTDTVQCGVYRRAALDACGGVDPELQFGEDEELNWRIVRAGYGILSTPSVRFHYYPRSSFRGLFRQYFNYGRARVRVIEKHPDFFRVKHLVPSAFVIILAGLLIAVPLHPVGRWLLVVTAGGYLGTSLTVSVLLALREGASLVALLPLSLASLHFGYGLGVLRGIIDWLCGPRGVASSPR